jgi:hypothetical protein
VNPTKIYTFMGAHGAGKSYLSNVLDKEDNHYLRFKNLPSPVSTWWKSISLANLQEKESWEQFHHQTAVLGALGYQLEMLEKIQETYLLDRSPLDVIAYSHHLMKKPNAESLPDHFMFLIKYAYLLTEKFVNTIIFIPYEEEIVGHGRGEFEAFREAKSNALQNDRLMKHVVAEYFKSALQEIEFPKTRLIVVTGNTESRKQQIIDGLIGKDSELQFCMNGFRLIDWYDTTILCP